MSAVQSPRKQACLPRITTRARLGFAAAAALTSITMLGSELSLFGLQADPQLVARAFGAKPELSAPPAATVAKVRASQPAVDHASPRKTNS